jgi:DNA (cytosine-5)-methyltransferase 1
MPLTNRDIMKTSFLKRYRVCQEATVMQTIELFAGAGGLALGVHRAGFEHKVVIERDKNTCVTINENKSRGLEPVVNWNLFDDDVRKFNYSPLAGKIDLVSGGPPCQPFSLGGKHRAYLDERDMFPEAVRAVRELQPRAFVFENVKGIQRSTFQRYFVYIQLQLTYPELTALPNEEWLDHLSRLEQHHTSGIDHGLHYRVVARLANAADYGVPQKRERVFFVGFRSDVHEAWSFPLPTHSQEALLWDQWVTFEYWDKHKISRKDIPETNSRLIHKAYRLLGDERVTDRLPWITVRDTIIDLPDPETDFDRTVILNHDYRPGARVYAGHTGSPLDEPAKALKAGDHGVPGGENMLLFPTGRVRYFTVRESARLQCFPDNYFFPVSWTESMRQLGNAVPVTLGYKIAHSVALALEGK